MSLVMHVAPLLPVHRATETPSPGLSCSSWTGIWPLGGSGGLGDDNPAIFSGHSLPALLSARADACPRCTRSSPRRAAPVGMSQMRQQCAGSPQFHCRRSESFIIVPPLCARYSPALAQLDRDARRCLAESRTSSYLCLNSAKILRGTETWHERVPSQVRKVSERSISRPASQLISICIGDWGRSKQRLRKTSPSNSGRRAVRDKCAAAHARQCSCSVTPALRCSVSRRSAGPEQAMARPEPAHTHVAGPAPQGAVVWGSLTEVPKHSY